MDDPAGGTQIAWDKGGGRATFQRGGTPNMPGAMWTVTDSRVEVYRINNGNFILINQFNGTNRATGSNASTNWVDITFAPPANANAWNLYTPGEMVRVDVYITANNGAGGGSLNNYIISRTTVAANKP
jgi:hypothetical protein